MRALLPLLLAAASFAPATPAVAEERTLASLVRAETCRTDVRSALDALRQRTARPPPVEAAPARLTAKDVNVPPSLTVLDGSCRPGAPRCPAKFKFDAEGHNIYDVDTTAAAERFYAEHPDTPTSGWDEVVFFTTFLTTEFGGAYYYPIANDVTGIAKTYLAERSGETYDYNALAGTGSQGFLKGTVLMSEWHKCLASRLSHAFPCDNSQPFKTDQRSIIGILGQEVGHRWGSFLYFMDGQVKSDDLLGRSLSHWSYYADTGGSPLEGNHWAANGASWDLADEKLAKYGPLDQYVMGLRPPEEVPPTLVVRAVQPPPCTDDKMDESAWDCGGTHPSTPPGEGVHHIGGLGRMVDVSEVVASEGPRLPAFPDTQRIIHLAVVLLELPDEAASQSELDLLDALRHAFARYYYEATDRRMRAITTLARRDDLGLFDFTLDAEGWKGLGEAQPLGDAPGVIALHPSFGENGIVHDQLALDTKREHFLQVRLSASGPLVGPMRASWWQEGEAKAPDGRGVELPLATDGRMRTYVIPLDGKEGWAEHIRGLSWQVASGVAGVGARVEIDSVETSENPLFPDTDGDLVADADDNCPSIANADQLDSNHDGIGNLCQPVSLPTPKGCGCSSDATPALALFALALARRRRSD